MKLYKLKIQIMCRSSLTFFFHLPKGNGSRSSDLCIVKSPTLQKEREIEEIQKKIYDDRKEKKKKKWVIKENMETKKSRNKKIEIA